MNGVTVKALEDSGTDKVLEDSSTDKALKDSGTDKALVDSGSNLKDSGRVCGNPQGIETGSKPYAVNVEFAEESKRKE